MNPGTLALINMLIQGGAAILTIIRHKDGTLTVVQVFDEAEAGFQANLKQFQDWAIAHPKPVA